MTDRFGPAVTSALDDLLLPLGFAPAQVSDGYAVYCTAKDDLLRHAPHLAADVADVPEGGCVDVIITTERGDVELRGELTTDLALGGRTLAEALPLVRRTLEEVLATPGAG